MSERMILVADSSRAKWFKRGDSWRDLELIDEQDNPRGRAHDGDLVTGAGGSVTHSASKGQRSATETEVSPSEHEADVFARKLADQLRHNRVNGLCSHVILVAAPAFLGRLRAALDTPTRDSVRQEVDKNLTQHTTAEISKILEKEFTV